MNQFDPVIIGALAVILAAVIAAGAGAFTVWYTSHLQRGRDKEARAENRAWRAASYRRTMQDAKRRRLHSAYANLLLAARAWQSTLAQMQIVTAADATVENRDDHLQRSLAKPLSPVNPALIAIDLEDVDSDVVRLFLEIRDAYRSYLAGEALRRQYASSESARADMQSIWEKMQHDKATVDAKVDELAIAMQTRLRELEEPLWLNDQVPQDKTASQQPSP